MCALPEVLAASEADGVVSFELRVDPALPQFRGHFDAAAILPGFVQIDWALSLARQRELPIGEVQHLAAIKFQRTIRPGAHLRLELRHDPHKRELAFRYLRAADASLHSSGRIGLEPAAP